MTISPLPGIDANARSLGSMSYWISGLGTGDNDTLAFGEAGGDFEISSSDGSIGNNTSTMSSTENKANVCLWQRSVYYNTNSSELTDKKQTTWNKAFKLVKDVLALITSFIYTYWTAEAIHLLKLLARCVRWEQVASLMLLMYYKQ